MPSQIFFGGNLLTTPTVASQINDDAMEPVSVGSGNFAAFIGNASGGAPGEILSFDNPTQARAVLRSGALCDAVASGFSPSTDEEVGAPSKIYCVNPGAATQSSLTLMDEADKESLLLKSVNYGTKENEIRIRLEKGTLNGYRPSVNFGKQYYSQDNVGRQLLTITPQEAVKITINSNSLKIVTTADPAVVVIEQTFSDDLTVSELVDILNSTGKLSADFGGGSGYLTLKDTADAVKDLAAEADKPVILTADTTELIRWLSATLPDLLTASLPEGTTEIVKPKTIPSTFLTGGTRTPATVEDWSAAFDLLYSIGAKWITALSAAEYIGAMLSAHLTFASKRLGKERRGVLGLPAGTTDKEAAKIATSLQDSRISVVHIGYYDYDEKGKLTLFPPYMTAARAAAMFSGVAPGVPLTNKIFRCFGMERTLSIPNDTDFLISNGVMPIAADDDGIVTVIRSISCWTNNNKYNLVEQSCGAALDATIQMVRDGMKSFKGSKGDQNTTSLGASRIQSQLKLAAEPAPTGPGYIVGDATHPAFKNIKTTLDGDALYGEFSCSPGIPVNFVLITVYADVYTGSVTLSTTD